MEYRSVYVTASGPEEARRIGRALVEERLAACVNILERIESIYWWDGAVRGDDEAAFFAKTRAELVERVVARVRELHSYDCPCVVALPIDAGNPEYLKWIVDSTIE